MHKEKYCLVIHLQQCDFLWALPTTVCASPELLLQDFVDLPGVVPSTIRCYNEFCENRLLKRWAEK